MGGACGAYGAGESGAQGSGEETWGKETTREARRRWGDNIKMDLQEVGGGWEDWMELAQDRDRWRALVSTVMNLRVSKMRGISWLAAKPVSFSRRTLPHGVSKWVSKLPVLFTSYGYSNIPLRLSLCGHLLPCFIHSCTRSRTALYFQVTCHVSAESLYEDRSMELEKKL